MESVLWSCTLVFAGLVAVVNAQCTSTNLLFNVDASPISSTIVALNDVTLTCSSTSDITPDTYSWHRVNGDVPSQASGQNTDTLTIHRIVPADGGEYYCMATLFGHCAVSDNVSVIVEGATVSFDQVIYIVSEAYGRSEPVLVLSNPSSTVITLQVFSTDGSATGKDIDYGSGPYTVQFNAGDMHASFNVSINNDIILEGNETFNLIVNASSLPKSVTVGDPGKTTVTIVDNDVLMVQFSQTNYSGSEASGAVHVMLLRGGTSTSNITVTVMLSDISAKGNGVDYTSIPINATFTSGSTDTMINVPVTMDHIVEEPETFSLSFTIPSLLSGKVIPGNITTANATITDDTMTSVNFRQSAYSVNFSQSAYSVDENDGIIQLTLVLSIPSSSDITIEVFSIDGSAIGDSDYLSGPYTAKFDPGMTSASFNVSITDNNILEIDENFELVIDMSSLPIGVTVGIPAQVTVTIVDDDVATVFFDQSIYSVSENIGLAQPEIVLSSPSSTDITVQVTVEQDTATEGDDYASGASGLYNVKIPAGQTRAKFNVSIKDDNTVESNEYFLLVITSESLPNKFSPGDPDKTNITIVENDGATVSFEQVAYTVSEVDGRAEPVLILSSPSSTVITLQVFSTEGSATGQDIDYDSGPYTVQFNAGDMRASFNVLINNDNRLENNETFILTVNASSLPNSVTVGDPGQTTMTIVDNDAKSCKVNKISGDLKARNNRKVKLTFSADHPDALFQCKVDNEIIKNCTSPQNFDRSIDNVVVRAYCIVDGKLQSQKRRRFVNRFN